MLLAVFGLDDDTCTLVLPDLLVFLRRNMMQRECWNAPIGRFSEAYLLISKHLTFWPRKSDENRNEC